MVKQVIGIVAAGACAAALAGCSGGIVYDTPTATGDESTWLDYTQTTDSYDSFSAAKDAGAFDVVSLAEQAENAEYNEVRANETLQIADGSWAGNATFNEGAYHNVMNDDEQTLELYYAPLRYYKLDVSLTTDESAKTVADNFIEAAGLTGQFGANDEDTYNLATTDEDDVLPVGNVTGYDVDHYMAVGKCTVNGEDGYWFVKVIGGWLRCYVTPLNTGFVVSENTQEYDTNIASYSDLEQNLLRLDANWQFTE